VKPNTFFKTNTLLLIAPWSNATEQVSDTLRYASPFLGIHPYNETANATQPSNINNISILFNNVQTNIKTKFISKQLHKV
jgi:hypothetical protein